MKYLDIGSNMVNIAGPAHWVPGESAGVVSALRGHSHGRRGRAGGRGYLSTLTKIRRLQIEFIFARQTCQTPHIMHMSTCQPHIMHMSTTSRPTLMYTAKSVTLNVPIYPDISLTTPSPQHCTHCCWCSSCSDSSKIRPYNEINSVFCNVVYQVYQLTASVISMSWGRHEQL